MLLECGLNHCWTGKDVPRRPRDRSARRDAIVGLRFKYNSHTQCLYRKHDRPSVVKWNIYRGRISRRYLNFFVRGFSGQSETTKNRETPAERCNRKHINFSYHKCNTRSVKKTALRIILTGTYAHCTRVRTITLDKNNNNVMHCVATVLIGTQCEKVSVCHHDLCRYY